MNSKPTRPKKSSRTGVRAVRRADTWEKFSRWIGSLNGVNWMFRGVTNVKYDLRPKIGRPEIRKDGYLRQNEKWLLDEFRRMARAHTTAENAPRNWWEWLALAQHHGLPTRLLDWTYSPLIAAYFAVEKEGADGDALIFGFKPSHFILPGETNPFQYDQILRFDPPHLSPRIIAQSATFSIHPNPTETIPESKKLKRLIIPRKFCDNLKARLHNLGINRATLFPDLDGVSGHLSWLHRQLVDANQYPLGAMNPEIDQD